MAFIASLRVTPKVAQAPTGAKVKPVMRPIIEMFDAGVLWMFQMTFASRRSSQGGVGAPHFSWSLLLADRFWRIRLFFAASTSPTTSAPSIARSSARYSASSGERAAQNRFHARSASSRASPSSVDGSTGGAAPSPVASASNARRIGEEPAQRLVARGVGPEAVPPRLRAVEAEARVVDGRQVADAGADVDVRLAAQAFELVLEARVLVERLDEGAHRELRRHPHLALDLREAGGREALRQPAPVGLELEVGGADQEVVGAEAVERLEPRAGALEVALERADVGRARRDDAPAEDADARLALGQGCVIEAASSSWPCPR